MDRAIKIWDWDGVVGKTDDFNEYAFGMILGKMNLPMNEGWYKSHFPGRKLEDAIRHYLLAEGLPETLLPAIAEAKKGFDGEYEAAIEAYEDAIELINRFKLEGHLQAIASGSRRPQIEAGMRKFGIASAFEVVVVSGDYLRGKPAPDSFRVAYEKALRITGGRHQPMDCTVFEDAPSGIAAAKAAGMYCVAVTHTHTARELTEAGADRVVNDLREVSFRVRDRRLA